MKYLIISFSLLVMSLPTQAAVGWFYADEVAAINKAMQNSRFLLDGARGSRLQSIEKTKNGFLIKLSYGCKIVLKKMNVHRARARGMTGPNAEVAYKIVKKKSFCKR